MSHSLTRRETILRSLDVLRTNFKRIKTTLMVRQTLSAQGCGGRGEGEEESDGAGRCWGGVGESGLWKVHHRLGDKGENVEDTRRGSKGLLEARTSQIDNRRGKEAAGEREISFHCRSY